MDPDFKALKYRHEINNTDKKLSKETLIVGKGR